MLRRILAPYPAKYEFGKQNEDEAKYARKLLSAWTHQGRNPGVSPGYLPCPLLYLRSLVCLSVCPISVALLVEKRVRQVKQAGKLEDVREREISFFQIGCCWDLAIASAAQQDRRVSRRHG